MQEIISSTSGLASALVLAASPPGPAGPGVFSHDAAIAFRIRHASWLAGFLITFGAKLSAAELVADDQTIPTLETQVVAADASESAVPPNTPATTYGIDSAQLDSINVVNAEDALEQAPNLAVRKRFIGDNNSIISVRSTSSRQSARSLVYADGLLLSNFLGSDFTFPPRWSLVAPEEIERVDVVYGPFSALYPGNSIGSTVLISTRMPDKFQADVAVQAFSQDFDLYGTHDTFGGQQESAYIGSRASKWSFLVRVNHLDNSSQPLSFFTARQSSTPAESTDTPVSGAIDYRDQAGNPGVLLGVNSEGSTRIIDDQVKLKLAYDITPDMDAAFTAVRWRQTLDNETGSYLRDANGNRVSTGSINIGGYQYVLPGNAFAPGDGEGDRSLYGASLRTHRDSGWNMQATASAFLTGEDIAGVANGPGAGPGTVTYGDGTGWRTFDVSADYRPSAAPEGHWLTFGYHYDRYKLDSVTYDASDWQARTLTDFNNAFAGITQTQALYAQDAWFFAPAWKLVAGLRFERWNARDGSRAQGDVELAYPAREDSYWSPKLAIEHDFTEGWTARLSLGKAHRLPTVSELFQGRITGTTLVNNDPNLKPENAFSKDLTFERRFEHARLRFSLYEDDIRDALFSQTNTTVFPTVTNIQNVDRVRTRGQEIAFEASDLFVPGFDLGASVAHNDARTLENAKNPATVGKHFYRIPLWRADAIATYRATRWLAYTLAAEYSGRQYNTLDNSDVNPDTFGGTSNYFSLNGTVNFSLGEHVALNVGVDNITDRQSFVFHPYPGRTFYAEGKVSY